MTCPKCEQSAEFHSYRTKTPLSILGPITCRRAYYYCHRCGGTTPWDEEVGLTPKQLTPAAEELVTLAGTVSNSFEEAAEKVLPKMAALDLAETTVQRTSEAAGRRLCAVLQDKKVLGGPRPWKWHKDARGQTCAYASIDATGVAQQACGGGQAEGRMPYVAMVFNPVPELPDTCPPPPPGARMQARYLAGLYELDELGLQLRRQAGQVGMEHVDQWIGLSDGGNGLETFLTKNFPRSNLALILDFWHAAEYLADLAKLLHPHDDDVMRQTLTAWCHTMKHQGGPSIVAELEKLTLPPRQPAVRDQYETTLQYLRNNLHRMDYPTYVANGWFIGSGSIESACKTVVGQRLKLAGMRWREKGTDEVCHLRALFKSESNQWESFWCRTITPYAMMNACSTN